MERDITNDTPVSEANMVTPPERLTNRTPASVWPRLGSNQTGKGRLTVGAAEQQAAANNRQAGRIFAILAGGNFCLTRPGKRCSVPAMLDGLEQPRRVPLPEPLEGGRGISYRAE